MAELSHGFALLPIQMSKQRLKQENEKEKNSLWISRFMATC